MSLPTDSGSVSSAGAGGSAPSSPASGLGRGLFAAAVPLDEQQAPWGSHLAAAGSKGQLQAPDAAAGGWAIAAGSPAHAGQLMLGGDGAGSPAAAAAQPPPAAAQHLGPAAAPVQNQEQRAVLAEHACMLLHRQVRPMRSSEHLSLRRRQRRSQPFKALLVGTSHLRRTPWPVFATADGRPAGAAGGSAVPSSPG